MSDDKKTGLGSASDIFFRPMSDQLEDDTDAADKTPRGRPPSPETVEKERRRQELRAPGRFTIDGNVALKELMRQLSMRYGCPMSQIAILLLVEGVERLEAGEIDIESRLSASTSPKFRTNLDLDDIFERLDNLLD